MSVAKILSNRIELSNVSQSFLSNDKKITLFSDVNLSIQQGHSYAITGPSGSGKSSLLTLMSGLCEPTTGNCQYQDANGTIPLPQIRDKIGFIFQQFHLLPELNALNNVALPLKLRGHKGALDKARYWLEKVGLEDRMQHKPSQLSGGEQQRVAIARALVFNPEFIFADEPTGNLDPGSAAEISQLLLSSCSENGAGLVIVTHSERLATQAEFSLSLPVKPFEWHSSEVEKSHGKENQNKENHNKGSQQGERHYA
ncbi:ABC transporter ATP-binding protein [Planctobacterium marinum]|uniref:ABC transporter ATP-binding protein n=1 Tax=Planctobacterium marinum TaxID=1631968 RepID=A0AA48KPW0_9ALTE|nr:ABC transporter ATP-binding protein [Planctobacterium marinum]